MKVTLSEATVEDVPAIAALWVAVFEQLTKEYGKGHWSPTGTEKGILKAVQTPRMFVVRQDGKQDGKIVATLRLATRKPWAIDPAYFTASTKPLYLTNMTVDPGLQRQGIGRQCVEEVCRIAREWPADTIRLDAYDAPAGAGGFYAKCGFREVGRVTYRKTPLVYYERLL